jgi:protein-S-isoprenylcysteine O-methyltransferase Ste14
MSDDETLADIDLGLLDIQQDLVRIVVLVSSVLVLQGLTLLILAWIADGFVVSILIGVIGAVVLIVGLGVWIGNFRAYGSAALQVDAAKEDHPARGQSEDSDSP